MLNFGGIIVVEEKELVGKQESKKGHEALKELRRRVDITYRTRIISANRLRNKNIKD